MDATAAMFGEGRRQARLCEAICRNAGAREWQPLGHTTLGTLPAPADCGLVSGKASSKLWIGHQKIAITSRWASICGRRDRPIRKKVIGHGMSVFGRGSPGTGSSCTCCGRSPWSISYRASIAAEFSSIQRSRRAPISLRRLAAWLRRESSKLCREVREAERRNSHGGCVL